jgi:hypothetical protein
VGVDADDADDELCQHGHCGGPPWVGRPWSASAWKESPRGTTVTGHNPCRVGQAADQASEVGQAAAGTTADSSELKATHRLPVAQRVMPRCQHQSLTTILPDRFHHTHSCGNAAMLASRARSDGRLRPGRVRFAPAATLACRQPVTGRGHTDVLDPQGRRFKERSPCDQSGSSPRLCSPSSHS